MKFLLLAIIINLSLTSSLLAKDRTGDFVCKNIQALELSSNGSVDTDYALDSQLTLFTIKKKSITKNYAFDSSYPSISKYSGYFTKSKNNPYLSEGSDVFMIDEDSRGSSVDPNYYVWNEYGFQQFRNVGYGKVRIYIYDCIKQ